jgi:tetratricopeptide (TPR) repeat protein
MRRANTWFATAVLICVVGTLPPQTFAVAKGPNAEPAAETPAVLGTELTQAFNQRNEAVLASLIDMNALGMRVASSMYDDETRRSAFARGFAQAGPHNILQSYFKTLDSTHGSVKLMKVAQRNGQPVLLIRVDLGGKGFDYLEFVLQKEGTGAYRLIDWFQLSRGETASVSIGALARLLIDPDPDLIHRMFGVPQVDEQLLSQMKQIGVLQRAGDFAGALGLMRQLPEPIANSRRLLIARAGLASLAGQTEAYKSALAALAQRYSNDPGAAFVLLDHYFFEHQMDKAMQAIEVIEGRVGADGMTNLLKANASLLRKDFDPATAFAQQAIRLEPELAQSYVALARGYVGEQKYTAAVSTYRVLMTRFGVKLQRQTFLKDPESAGFVQSEAFNKWLPQ